MISSHDRYLHPGKDPTWVPHYLADSQCLVPQVRRPYLPAQSLPRGLSASGSMIDAGVLVGSHGHVGSLQTQSPAKTTLL